MQILLKLILIMKQEDPALSPLALATAAPGVRSSWSSPPLSCSSATASPRRSSTRRGRGRRRRRRRPARRRPRSQNLQSCPASHLHVAIPSPHPPSAGGATSRLPADVDADLDLRHPLRHLRRTPPLMYKCRHPTLKMLWSYFNLFHDWVVGYSSSVLKYRCMICPKTCLPDLPKLCQRPLLFKKGRRSCYKLKVCHLLLISKGAQIVIHLLLSCCYS